jgi:hypothetical protein
MHEHPATPANPSKRELRLRAKVGKFASDGDSMVAWTRAWVSREGRLHALAARTYDYIVVTEHDLLIISTGFFSRRPRRLVFAAPIAALRVNDNGSAPGHILRVYRARQKTLRFEMRGDRHSVAVCTTLLRQVGLRPGEAAPS